MKILVVAPHADDEILGVGATIAKHIEMGNEVFVCIVTSGHPTMYTEQRLIQVKDETLLAHEYLGISKTFFLDFPAVMLQGTAVHLINEKILGVVDQVKPDIAYIPHFGDMHIDHYIVAQSAMVAMRPIGNHIIKEIYSYETLSETEWNTPHATNAFLVNTWNDISGSFLEKKIEAMKLFGSQLREFPHPRSIEAIRSLAKLRGSTVGVIAAEAFSLIRRIHF